MRLDTKGVGWFILLTFAGAWLMEGWLWTQGGLGNPVAQYVLMAVMLVPALSAVIVRVFITREGFGDAGLRVGRKRYLLAAWLIFPILFTVAGGLSVALGQARFDPTLSQVFILAGAQAVELRTMPLETVFLALLIQGLTISTLFTAVFTFGEEFGWRGFLTVKLLPLGRNPSMLVTGVIWGLWHAPVILMGYNYPTQPVWGVLLMTVFCVWISFILGWLRLASGSVWPAVLGHAVINSGAMVPMFLVAGFDTAIGSPLGIIGWIPLGAFVLWLHFTGRLNQTA